MPPTRGHDECLDVLEIARARGLDVMRWFAGPGKKSRCVPRATFAQKLSGVALGLGAGADFALASKIEAALEPSAVEGFCDRFRVDRAGGEVCVDVCLIVDALDRRAPLTRPSGASPARFPLPFAEVPPAPPPSTARRGAAPPPAPPTASKGLEAALAAKQGEAVKVALVHLRRGLLSQPAPSVRRSNKEKTAPPLEAREVTVPALAEALRAAGLTSLREDQVRALLAEAAAPTLPGARPRHGRLRSASFSAIRAYLWRLRAAALAKDQNHPATEHHHHHHHHQPNPPTFAAWSHAADKRRKKAKLTAFRRALAGLDHGLDEADLHAMLLKYQVIKSQEELQAAVDMLTERWLRTGDGRHAVLKEGSTVAAVRRKKRVELLEAEARMGVVTLAL